MKLFLDTEFNGFDGDLISMALVSGDDRQWYQVLMSPTNIDPWVAENVIPYLDQQPVDKEFFGASLQNFLSNFYGCEIIADWPADFQHLCRWMTGMGANIGWQIPIECTMKLVVSPELNPEVPHNALSDAKALRKWYLEAYK